MTGFFSLFIVAVKCLENQFECLDNQVVIDCIPMDWKCDEGKDCADNADEMDCDLLTGRRTLNILLIRSYWL